MLLKFLLIKKGERFSFVHVHVRGQTAWPYSNKSSLCKTEPKEKKNTSENLFDTLDIHAS